MLNIFGLTADDERRVRRGRHAGDHLQQADVLGRAAELVVAHQHAVRLAAELAVFLLVDLLEQSRLWSNSTAFSRSLNSLVLGDVQDADLEVLAGLGLVDEVVQPAPGRLPASGSRGGA